MKKFLLISLFLSTSAFAMGPKPTPIDMGLSEKEKVQLFEGADVAGGIIGRDCKMIRVSYDNTQDGNRTIRFTLEDAKKAVTFVNAGTPREPSGKFTVIRSTDAQNNLVVQTRDYMEDPKASCGFGGCELKLTDEKITYVISQDKKLVGYKKEYHWIRAHHPYDNEGAIEVNCIR